VFIAQAASSSGTGKWF